MSWGGVVRGCIAFTLWLLGFSKPLHSALKLGHRVFFHVIVCVLGIMVFPFSCQFDLAAYTGSKYYSWGSGLIAETCLAFFAYRARVPERIIKTPEIN